VCEPHGPAKSQAFAADRRWVQGGAAQCFWVASCCNPVPRKLTHTPEGVDLLRPPARTGASPCNPALSRSAGVRAHAPHSHCRHTACRLSARRSWQRRMHTRQALHSCEPAQHSLVRVNFLGKLREHAHMQLALLRCWGQCRAAACMHRHTPHVHAACKTAARMFTPPQPRTHACMHTAAHAQLHVHSHACAHVRTHARTHPSGSVPSPAARSSSSANSCSFRKPCGARRTSVEDSFPSCTTVRRLAGGWRSTGCSTCAHVRTHTNRWRHSF